MSTYKITKKNKIYKTSLLNVGSEAKEWTISHIIIGDEVTFLFYNDSVLGKL